MDRDRGCCLKIALGGCLLVVLSALVLGGALFFSFRQGGPVREEVSQVLAEEAQKAGAFGSLDEALVFARSQVDQGQEHFSFKLLGQDLFLPVDQVNDRFHQAFSSRETYGFIYYKGFQWEKDKLDYRFQIDYYPGGDQERTLATIREWIQEEGILDLDQEARVKAIHDAIVFKNDYYSSQSGLDPSSTYSIYLPESLLYGQGGVCQAYASLFLMMAREAGLEADFVVGQAGGVDHAWNMVQVDGTWYHVDVTWDDPVGPVDIIYDYYLLSTDSILGKDHQIDPGQDLPLDQAQEDYGQNYGRKNWYDFNYGDLPLDSPEVQAKEEALAHYRQRRTPYLIENQGASQEALLGQVGEAVLAGWLQEGVLILEVGDLDASSLFKAIQAQLKDLAQGGYLKSYSMTTNNSGDYIVLDDGELGTILGF